VEKVWNFPHVPATANRALRMHWAVRARERKLWGLLMASAGRPPRRPPWRARVEIVVRRSKRQDQDNAMASIKPVLDALRARGWLLDDSPEHLEVEVREEASRARETWIRWTVLEVERKG
jgi:Holliday junction resolvase RusA-like endonuclease